MVKATKDGLTASVTVTNTGERAGKEVVELYVSAPAGGLEKPACELKAFAKTRELKPGEKQTLTMQIPVRMLASFDEANSRWITEAGEYVFAIGNSSRNIAVTTKVKIKEYTEPVSNVLKKNN